MAKNLLFTLFVLVVALTCPAFSEAKNGFENSGNEYENCQAPPPDSFRVTAAGGDFITLAWTPAWNGATHTLIVFLKNENNNTWEPIDTFQNVPGSSFTYFGSTPPVTRYGFSIATRCNNGETSSENDFVTPPIGVILDLTLGGRFPTNPAPVSPCTEIKYENHDWVGFYVKKNYGELQPHNFFEVTVEEGHPVVKRTIYGSPVVAGTADYQYPRNPPPSDHIYLYELPRFLVFEDRGDNLFDEAGWLNISLGQIGQDKIMKICKEPGWSTGYNFQTFVAQPSHHFSAGSTRFDTNWENNITREIRLQSPVADQLTLFLPHQDESNQIVKITLWSPSGYMIDLGAFELGQNSLSLPVNELIPGIYFLSVENGSGRKIAKFVKI